MSGPPPPPRRRKPNPLVSTIDSNNNNNVSRSPTKKQQSSSISPIKNLNKDKSEDNLDNLSIISSNSVKQIEIPASTIAYNEFNTILNDSIEPDQIPETVIGPGVDVRGNMQFERLLRVEGKFQGSIISQGDLVVGRNGCVIANITNLRTVTVNGGKITGDINVEKVILRKGSSVSGNIVCKKILCEKYVAINGNCNIHILAPEIIDSNGDIIIPVPEIEVGMPSHAQHDKKKGRRKKSSAEFYSNENVIPIEEQKNKLKAEKQLRKEQMMKLEATEETDVSRNINPAVEDNSANQPAVSKGTSVNNVPNFNFQEPEVPKGVSPKPVSPRLSIRRENASLPLPDSILNYIEKNNPITNDPIATGGSDSNVESSIKDKGLTNDPIATGGSDSNVESSIKDKGLTNDPIATGGSDSNVESSIKNNDNAETTVNNIESNEIDLLQNNDNTDSSAKNIEQ